METFDLAESASAGPSTGSYWVVEGRLAGGVFPFKADVDDGRRVLAGLEAVGFDRFVNLTRNAEPDSTDAHLVDYAAHLSAGTRMLSHPITDLGVPTPAEMIAVLDSIDSGLGAGHNLYVHCWGGVGRTGTVIGCWLVRHGFVHPGRVIDLLARLRRQDLRAGHRRSPETDQQVAFVERWLPGT